MTVEGAKFGEINPVNANGVLTPFSFSAWVADATAFPTAAGSRRLITLGNLKPGQDLLLTLRITTSGGNITRVRLKPWWLVSNREFRGPGFTDQGVLDAAAAYLPIDVAVYGALTGGIVTDTDILWCESLKRRDLLGVGVPARHSTSLWLADLWEFETDPTISGLNRQEKLFYPVHGRALAITGDFTFDEPQPPPPVVQVSYTVGKAASGGGA